MLQRTGLAVTIHHDQHLLGIQYCSYTHRQRSLRHLVHVVVEETAVGNDSVRRKRLLASTRCKRRSRLVERNMTVRTNAAQEQVDTAKLANHLLVMSTLCRQIRRIAIENMYVLTANVDMREEIVPHKAVIAFRMLHRQTHILVHIERHNVLERNNTFFVQLNQVLIHAQRRRAGRQTQHKRMLLGRLSLQDLLCRVVCCPF